MTAEEEHKKIADGLEHAVSLLQRHIRSLRGEEVDWTGLGLQRIALDQIERILGVRIIQEEWYRELMKREKERETSDGANKPK